MSDTYEPKVPDGLDVLVMTVLAYHVGRGKAVGRVDLVANVAALGMRVNERAVRECIKQLRRSGKLICSMPGTDGGYYIASNRAEFDEFDRAEFEAKIADMSETRKAMRDAARVEYGDAVQMSLM